MGALPGEENERAWRELFEHGRWTLDGRSKGQGGQPLVVPLFRFEILGVVVAV